MEIIRDKLLTSVQTAEEVAGFLCDMLKLDPSISIRYGMANLRKGVLLGFQNYCR